MYLLGVVAGEYAGARGPAPACGVVLGESKAGGGEGREIRRSNISAVTFGIGIAHVIGQDKKDIRLA